MRTKIWKIGFSEKKVLFIGHDRYKFLKRITKSALWRVQTSFEDFKSMTTRGCSGKQTRPLFMLRGVRKKNKGIQFEREPRRPRGTENLGDILKS